jgi:hypothetical protein
MRTRADCCEYGNEHSVLRDKWEIYLTGMLLSASETEAWHWPPNSYSAKVKGRVELHLYSRSGPSWPPVGWTASEGLSKQGGRSCSACDLNSGGFWFELAKNSVLAIFCGFLLLPAAKAWLVPHFNPQPLHSVFTTLFTIPSFRRHWKRIS